jgi:hypothetical protein
MASEDLSGLPSPEAGKVPGKELGNAGPKVDCAMDRDDQSKRADSFGVLLSLVITEMSSGVSQPSRDCE